MPVSNSNAVLSLVSRDTLLTRARQLDDERALGKSRGPFHGIPILVKASRVAVDHLLAWTLC